MTVYWNKSRKRWMYDFERAGTRYAGYCVDAFGKAVKSEAAARQAEAVAKHKAELAPKLPAGDDVTIAMVMADLVRRWRIKPSWRNRKLHVGEILAHFGHDTPIRSIDGAGIENYITRSLTQATRRWHGGPLRDPSDPVNDRFWTYSGPPRSPATVNLYLTVLRQVLERAEKMTDPQTGRPVLERAPDVDDVPVTKRKARPMPDQVTADIVAILPPHTVDAIMLTLLFGFRKGEAYGLRRHQVQWDLDGILLAGEDVKDREDAFLPASQMAMGYLRCLDLEAEERGVDHLISWRPARGKKVTRHHAKPMPAWRPLKSSTSAWDRARELMLDKYGRTWRWHDLRAAFITHVAMTSGPIAAQALARHSDYDTTRGYIEVANDFTRDAAERASQRPLLRVAKP